MTVIAALEAERQAEAAVGDPAVLDVVGEVLMAVRKAKSAQHRSQRSAVTRLLVADDGDRLGTLRQGQDDLCRAGTVQHLELRAAPDRAITVELAPVPDPERARE